MSNTRDDEFDELIERGRAARRQMQEIIAESRRVCMSAGREKSLFRRLSPGSTAPVD